LRAAAIYAPAANELQPVLASHDHMLGVGGRRFNDGRHKLCAGPVVSGDNTRRENSH
jgi:hypothetical protein